MRLRDEVLKMLNRGKGIEKLSRDLLNLYKWSDAILILPLRWRDEYNNIEKYGVCIKFGIKSYYVIGGKEDYEYRTRMERDILIPATMINRENFEKLFCNHKGHYYRDRL